MTSSHPYRQNVPFKDLHNSSRVSLVDKQEMGHNDYRPLNSNAASNSTASLMRKNRVELDSYHLSAKSTDTVNSTTTSNTPSPIRTKANLASVSNSPNGQPIANKPLPQYSQLSNPSETPLFPYTKTSNNGSSNNPSPNNISTSIAFKRTLDPTSSNSSSPIRDNFPSYTMRQPMRSGSPSRTESPTRPTQFNHPYSNLSPDQKANVGNTKAPTKVARSNEKVESSTSSHTGSGVGLNEKPFSLKDTQNLTKNTPLSTTANNSKSPIYKSPKDKSSAFNTSPESSNYSSAVTSFKTEIALNKQDNVNKLKGNGDNHDQDDDYMNIGANSPIKKMLRHAQDQTQNEPESPSIYQLSSTLASTSLGFKPFEKIHVVKTGSSNYAKDDGENNTKKAVIPEYMLESGQKNSGAKSEKATSGTSTPDRISNGNHTNQSSPEIFDFKNGSGNFFNSISSGISEQTFESYSKNAKKIKDPEALLEYAKMLIRMGLALNINNSGSNVSFKANLEKQKQYFDESHDLLKRAVKANYLDAQYFLGDAYACGIFGKIDESKALYYFENAGKNKHADGAFRTALCYKKGIGCRPDARKVIKYLNIAALNNHPIAMMDLGIYSFHGLMGLSDDINTKKQGISWLRRSCEVVNEFSAGALYELGLIHLNGFKDIVIKDVNYAVKLFFKGSNLGHVKCSNILGKIYEGGISGFIEPNSDLSIHFYNSSAEKGDVEGMMGLCSWYFVGAPPNLNKDYDEAFAWALRAAEKKCYKAMLLLNRFYQLGIGCEKDEERGRYWLNLSNEFKKDK